MTALAPACVFIGGGLGACLRWGFSLLLNPVSQVVPLGTLAVKLIGGYLIGIAAALFTLKSPPQVRLLASPSI